ncbi:glutathione S-transferase omega-1-like [Lytechinus pictus]|uniref:glutathione S-transferase omega-1-like n=1 Tax=Lytechinus pictus TaxID=7653 RepID=UPI0030B9C207
MPAEHHFKTGETLPALKPGVLRLYSMAFCPYAERTRLVLAAKDIDYELVNVNTYKKPEWYFDKNPDGLVPTLELDDKLIQESLVTCEYLDEAYPDTPMYPADAYLKARDKLFIQRFGNSIPAFYRSAKEKGKNEELRTTLLKHMNSIEDELQNRGTPFFFGSSPGMVDYAIWPFIYRIPSSMALGSGGLPESLVLLHQWIDRMRKHEIIAPRIMEDEALVEFSTHYRTPGSRFDEIQTKSVK